MARVTLEAVTRRFHIRIRGQSLPAHTHAHLWLAKLLTSAPFSQGKNLADLSLFLLLPAMHLAVFLLPSVMHVAALSMTVTCFRSWLHSALAAVEQPILDQKVQKYGNK